MFQIMVVDDDRNTRRLLQAVLEADGYKVLTAENGEDALALMDSEYVDLVVLDIMMPKVNGLTVLRTLRARGSALPVLLLTARDAVADRVDGLDAGADDYLIKPFDYNRFQSALQKRPGEIGNHGRKWGTGKSHISQ